MDLMVFYLLQKSSDQKIRKNLMVKMHLRRIVPKMMSKIKNQMKITMTKKFKKKIQMKIKKKILEKQPRKH